jgi:hypothetical protein
MPTDVTGGQTGQFSFSSAALRISSNVAPAVAFVLEVCAAIDGVS